MSDLTVPFETENVHDDDGAVIDSFFVETDDTPDLKPAAEPIPSKALTEPKPCTKLLTFSVTADATFGYTLIFPEDAKRKGLTVKVVSPTAVATDGVRIASDPGLVYNAARVFHGQQLSDALMEHTGPLYFLPCGNGTGGAVSAPISVEAWAVTY